MLNRLSKYPLYKEGGRISPFEGRYLPIHDPNYQQMMVQGMAGLQQRSDTINAQMNEMMSKIGTMETDAPEVMGAQVDAFKQDLDKISGDYGNNYAYAATKLAKRVAAESSNPIYQFNRKQVEQSKLFQQGRLQLGEHMLVKNDPRGNEALKRAIAENDMSKLNAEFYQADDYAKIALDLPIKEITESLGLKRADVLGYLKHGHTSGISVERLEEAARKYLDAFKARAANRTHDNREGYEWVHDDEKIIDFIVNTNFGKTGMSESESFIFNQTEAEDRAVARAKEAAKIAAGNRNSSTISSLVVSMGTDDTIGIAGHSSVKKLTKAARDGDPNALTMVENITSMAVEGIDSKKEIEGKPLLREELNSRLIDGFTYNPYLRNINKESQDRILNVSYESILSSMNNTKNQGNIKKDIYNELKESSPEIISQLKNDFLNRSKKASVFIGGKGWEQLVGTPPDEQALINYLFNSTEKVDAYKMKGPNKPKRSSFSIAAGRALTPQPRKVDPILTNMGIFKNNYEKEISGVLNNYVNSNASSANIMHATSPEAIKVSSNYLRTFLNTPTGFLSDKGKILTDKERIIIGELLGKGAISFTTATSNNNTQINLHTPDGKIGAKLTFGGSHEDIFRATRQLGAQLRDMNMISSATQEYVNKREPKIFEKYEDLDTETPLSIEEFTNSYIPLEALRPGVPPNTYAIGRFMHEGRVEWGLVETTPVNNYRDIMTNAVVFTTGGNALPAVTPYAEILAGILGEGTFIGEDVGEFVDIILRNLWEIGKVGKEATNLGMIENQFKEDKTSNASHINAIP